VRILFLINTLPVGGFETLMLEVFRSMREEGDLEVAAVCLKDAGGLAPEFERLGIPVHSGFVRWKYDFTAVHRVRKILAGQRFDLAFLELGRNALMAGEYLARKLGIPRRLASIHGTFQGDTERLLRPGQLQLLSRLDGVVACAETQARYLADEEGVPAPLLKVIVNGVDHRRFRPVPADRLPPWPDAPADPRRGIATVASLNPRKGHLAFVDAAETVLRTVPDATFFILGGGPERERIQAHIRAKGLEKSVILLGIRRDLPELLPRFRAVALCATPDGETLPISTMEAMACGLPVVNTDVGSVRDLVVPGEHGWIVPTGDVAAMADAFTQVLTDDARAARMGAAARKRIEERFTLERAVREYGEYFRAVATGARRTA
jgi:glycosyltransferase involved in cell wall biosynthesis